MNPSSIISLTLLIAAHQCSASSVISKDEVNSTLQATKLQAQRVLRSAFTSFGQLSSEISHKAQESSEFANFTIKSFIDLQLDHLEDFKEGAQEKNTSDCFEFNKERLLILEKIFVLSAQTCVQKVKDDLLLEVVSAFDYILGYVKIIRQLEIDLGGCQDLDWKCIKDVADALEEDYSAQMMTDALSFVASIESNERMLNCIKVSANNCKDSGKIVLEEAKICLGQ